jgi:hypothetical protein
MPGGYVGGRPKDESKLSTNPAHIRARLRRQNSTLNRDLELYAQHSGFKPVAEWDLIELAKGRPRNKDGAFRGPSPKWLTFEIAQEAKKRLLDETFGELAQYATRAVKVIYDLMLSDAVDDNGKPVVDAKTRLAAATFIVEHIIGKPKAVVELEATDFTRQALASAIVLDDGLPQDPEIVLEGEIVEDDDDADGE